jgi:hypothetical protein
MADPTKDDHYNGHYLTATGIVVITTNSISLYNAIELLLLIFVTFKRYEGFYFWSLLVASFGNIPYSLGYVISYFQLTYSSVGLAINNVGWWLMVTGQSFVLYSRLHLVLSDKKILRAVLVMIIVDGIIFHIPSTILNFYSNYGADPLAAAEGYKVYEKVQMTGFCIQETIISGLYMWKTIQLLKILATPEARRTMWQLLIINMIIILMDVGLLAIEYRNLRVDEQVFKGAFYSIKVKLEYAILGKLVQIAQGGNRSLIEVLRDQDPYGLEARKRSSAAGVIRSDTDKTGWVHAETPEKLKIEPVSNEGGVRADDDSEKDLYAEAVRQVSAG